jgi:prophage maintenance system killer protein
VGADARDDAPSRLTVWHPTLADVRAANLEILTTYGYPERYALLDRGFIEHTLEQARLKHTPEGNALTAIDAAAELAHGIARAQGFRDGNHRTAHAITQTFLHNNGLGALSPLGEDDVDLTEHIEGTGIKFQPATFGPEDTVRLLRNRLPI